MMSFDMLVTRIDGLEQDDLARWITNDWVRPDVADGGYVFRDIDVARVHLILDLREDMDVDEAALPIVLSLLDQLYDVRRRLRAIAEFAPDGMRRAPRVIAL